MFYHITHHKRREVALFCRWCSCDLKGRASQKKVDQLNYPCLFLNPILACKNVKACLWQQCWVRPFLPTAETRSTAWWTPWLGIQSLSQYEFWDTDTMMLRFRWLHTNGNTVLNTVLKIFLNTTHWMFKTTVVLLTFCASRYMWLWPCSHDSPRSDFSPGLYLEFMQQQRKPREVWFLQVRSKPHKEVVWIWLKSDF